MHANNKIVYCGNVTATPFKLIHLAKTQVNNNGSNQAIFIARYVYMF